MSHSFDEYKIDPFLATEDIGNILHCGSLMLFMGAGVSRGFGLPNWHTLIARLLGKDSEPAFMAELKKKSDRDLALMIDPLDDVSKEYVDKVSKALYSGVAEELTDQLMSSPLLLAVAALITGSRRGRVTSVVTYNYDDLLKQYLDMLGYAVCVRKEFRNLSTLGDVEINHVHGYIPQSGIDVSDPKELVLSEKSYRSRRASIDERWAPYVAHCLYSKIGLFIGLSGNDSLILDNLQRVKDKIGRRPSYNGFWLMTPEHFSENHRLILDVGMCPIMLKEEEFPKFVFKVCQKAA